MYNWPSVRKEELMALFYHCITSVQCPGFMKGMQFKKGEGNMIKLVLVDDQATVRQGLRMRLLLEPDINVVGEASTGKEALTLVQQLHPDVVLMDIEMPDMDGITSTVALHTIVPHSAVVMLSIHSDSKTRARAFAAGAVSFVEKRGSTEELVSAIRKASQPGT
jgi:DNA-binding NarL/FixJ family response regulator